METKPQMTDRQSCQTYARPNDRGIKRTSDRIDFCYLNQMALQEHLMYNKWLNLPKKKRIMLQYDEHSLKTLKSRWKWENNEKELK